LQFFFMYYNFAMWIIDTFEIQNKSSGAVMSEVLGKVVWVIIQHMILPMIIFMLLYKRFAQLLMTSLLLILHAFVFCIELEKQSVCRGEKLIILMLSLNAWLLLACIKYWILFILVTWFSMLYAEQTHTKES